MKKVLILIAVPAVVLSLLAGRLCRQEIRETPGRWSHVILSDFVQLYSLRRSADSTHMVKVAATDGTFWFREEKPGFSLVACDPRKVYIEEFVEGEFSVLLGVLEDYWDALELWCDTRREKMVGIVVDSEVVYAQPLWVPIRSRIAIPIFRTREEAQEFQERILSEGFEELP